MEKSNRARDSAKEFAAYVRGDHPDEKGYRRYVRGQLRIADVRARMYLLAIREIREDFRDGVIDTDTAIEELRNADALHFLHEHEEESDGE